MKNAARPIITVIIAMFLLTGLSGCLEEKGEEPERFRQSRGEIASSAIDLVLNVPETSNNELLNIPGKIGPGMRVFINETEVEQDPFGNFNAQIRLTPKRNYIPVRVVSEDGKAVYSTAKVVHYNENGNPYLDVVIPQAFTSRDPKMIISGITDPNCMIRANGNSALPDENGNFIVEVPLEEGDNIVKVVATNPQGRTSTAQRVVSYNVPKNMQPLLVVSSPEPSPDGYVSSERLRIVGFTDPYNIIEIYNNYYNGDETVKSLVFKGTIPRNGQFSVDVNLSTTGTGVNDLQIVATNENGGTATESRRVTYKEPYVEEPEY